MSNPEALPSEGVDVQPMHPMHLVQRMQRELDPMRHFADERDRAEEVDAADQAEAGQFLSVKDWSEAVASQSAFNQSQSGVNVETIRLFGEARGRFEENEARIENLTNRVAAMEKSLGDLAELIGTVVGFLKSIQTVWASGPESEG